MTPDPTLSRDSAAQRAFTLTELLTIIFVLLLLVALILPALATSEDGGKRTICVNNLKRLGMAGAMYANDNRDYLAFPNWGSSTAGWLYAPFFGNPPDPTPAGYRSGLWYRYLSDSRVYLCPVDASTVAYQTPSVQSARLNHLSSYVMNGAVCGYAQVNQSCRLSDIWNPGCYLLWVPDATSINPNTGSPNGAFEWNDASNYPDLSYGEQVDRLHSADGSEVLSVAGDVIFVTRQKFTAESSYAGTQQQPRSLLWWSTFSGNGH